MYGKPYNAPVPAETLFLGGATESTVSSLSPVHHAPTLAPMESFTRSSTDGRYATRLANAHTPSISITSFDRYDDIADARAVAAWMRSRYGAAYVVTVYDTTTRQAVA